MGTHPIFESDFDCLTDFGSEINGRMKSLLFLTLLAAAKNIGDFTTKDIHGNAVDMSRYLGFVTQKFGVTFDMMAKTTVNGDNPEPVIAWAKNHPNGSGFLFNTIKWNFTK